MRKKFLQELSGNSDLACSDKAGTACAYEPWAVPENREFKTKSVFSVKDMHCGPVLTFVTYRVTNFLPKPWTCFYFLWKKTELKTEFPFFEFPYFRVLSKACRLQVAQVKDVRTEIRFPVEYHFRVTFSQALSQKELFFVLVAAKALRREKQGGQFFWAKY